LTPITLGGEGETWKKKWGEVYLEHGNKNNNSNRHIVYRFVFKPTDDLTPILKYGISDEIGNDLNRPERQLSSLRTKYGPTVIYQILPER
jgi:hypothetical protein